MVSKKKKKIILISIISLVLIAAIAIGIVFIVKNKKTSNSDTPIAGQVNISSNASNKAIADGLIPTNYNGVYKFSSLDLEFSENLNHQEKQALLNNKGVGDLNALKDLLKREKQNQLKSSGELLVLRDGNFNRTTGKNQTPVKNSAGRYIGDDNLSLVTINSTNEQFYISLNYSSHKDALAVSQNSNSDGTKLYLFQKIYSKYDPELVLINITYVYEINSVEEEFDESIYDFYF